MSSIASTSLTSTGLTNKCVRPGCQIVSMHTLGACSPSNSTPCNEEECYDPEPHGVKDCNPQFDLCTDEYHQAAGKHTVHDCRSFSETGTYGYAVGQVHPQTRLTTLPPSSTAVTSTELVRYTGPDLVHVPRVETPLEDEPVEDPQGCPDWTTCPIRGDHPRGSKCSDYINWRQRQAKKPRSNKVTLKMRLKRFLNRTRPARQSFRDALVYWTARIPLALGLLNSLYALSMLLETTASMMNTSVFNPIAVVISESFYALVVMIALNFTSKHQSIPSENLFNRYLNHIRTGTAFLATSCAFEVAVFLFQRR